MTCKRFCHSVQSGKHTLRRAIGLVLIVAILAVQTSATPRSVKRNVVGHSVRFNLLVSLQRVGGVVEPFIHRTVVASAARDPI